MANYYVDSDAGNDGWAGDIDHPWQTLAKVTASTFVAGDCVYFKRGCSWAESLTIAESGAAGNPITFSAYGVGDDPVFSLHAGTQCVYVQGDYLIFEHLTVHDCLQAAFYITGSYAILQDFEIYDTGYGVNSNEDDTTITRFYIHDLKMIVSDPAPDNDYGAIGCLVQQQNCTISYGIAENCRAVSEDYGYDGGFVEIWADSSATVNGLHIHHCWVEGCEGFIEAGGDGTGQAHDCVIEHCVSYNNYRFSLISNSGVWLVDIDNWEIYHNSIIEYNASDESYLIRFSTNPSAAEYTFKNNIVYANSFSSVSNQTGWTHTHNLYLCTGGTTLGFSLGIGEDSVSDLGLVDVAGGDFHLLPTSPAINTGTDLSYALDYDDNPMPVGCAPDIGAFEYQSAIGLVYDTDPNLVSAWMLDEASGTRYDNMGRNNLTDNNTVGQDLVNKKQGIASANFEYDNSEYLSITDGAQSRLDLTGPCSFVCWLRPESLSGSTSYLMTKWSLGTDEAYAFASALSSDMGGVDLGLSANGTTHTTAYTAGGLIVAGTWAHVVAVYNGTDIRLYVNGALQNNDTHNPCAFSSVIHNSDAPFYVGARGSPATRFYDGLMDEALIFDRALTPTEVAGLYYEGLQNGRRPGSEQTLIEARVSHQRLRW